MARGSTSLVWRCVERTGTRLVGIWTCKDGCRLVVETFSGSGRRWRRWAWRVLGRPGCWFVWVGHVIRVDPSTSDRRLGLLQIYNTPVIPRLPGLYLDGYDCFNSYIK